MTVEARPRILILSKNPDIRRLIRVQILKYHGLDAEETGSMVEALSAAEACPVDVCICSGFSWEEGARLYATLLNYQGNDCQFVLFMSDPASAPRLAHQSFPIITKPDFKKLLQVIDWSRVGGRR